MHNGEFTSSNNNIPEHLKSNLHYFNLNNQLKYDLEQQNAIKMQQLEAIRLIQLSLEKLTATTTVPLHNQTTRAKTPKTTSSLTSNAGSNRLSTPSAHAPPPTILVYKETSLHKNLLVSKILNKAKCFYYQSIVQTMRLSLMSKLNYYSSLIQQLYPSETNANATPTVTTSMPSGKLSDETNLIDEMKLLMQQILHDTFQFNLTNSSLLDLNANSTVKSSSSSSTSTTTTTITAMSEINERTGLSSQEEQQSSDIAHHNEHHIEQIAAQSKEADQIKRIKQLNDVKLSLYTLLFPPVSPLASEAVATDVQNEPKRKRSDDSLTYNNNNINNNNNKTCSINKRLKSDCEIPVDSNNNHVILGDDTNVEKPPKTIKKIKHHHISSKLLKLSLKTATKAVSAEASTADSQQIASAIRLNDNFVNVKVLA